MAIALTTCQLERSLKHIHGFGFSPNGDMILLNVEAFVFEPADLDKLRVRLEVILPHERSESVAGHLELLPKNGVRHLSRYKFHLADPKQRSLFKFVRDRQYSNVKTIEFMVSPRVIPYPNPFFQPPSS